MAVRCQGLLARILKGELSQGDREEPRAPVPMDSSPWASNQGWTQAKGKHTASPPPKLEGSSLPAAAPQPALGLPGMGTRVGWVQTQAVAQVPALVSQPACAQLLPP